MVSILCHWCHVVSCVSLQKWSDVKHRYRYSRERNWEAQWCKRNFLNKKTLNDVSDLVKELTKRLARFNIKPTRSLHTK